MDSEYLQVQRVRKYITGILAASKDDVEVQLVTKTKAILSLAFRGGFWQIFCSKKLNVIVEPTQRYLEFEITHDSKKYRLIAF